MKEGSTVYTICVKFACADGKRSAFIERVKAEGILTAIQAEEGCIRYEYYSSENHDNELLLIEQWESKAHQQAHIEQPHMARLRGFKGEYITDTQLREVEIK